ncbi:unnamed protein product [Orchesella dallaii]|uniref:Aminotransferase class I/classII large domain-containing protein n=1 Tax=Orchesella dallaii TaxID=48710 RepID=A0ABP1QX60_9HEXA
MENNGETTMKSTLSRRSQRIPIDLDYVRNYSSWPAIQNPYHETENPEGIVNFGTAVSGLMDDVWLERLNTIPVYEPNYKHFRYYQFWGPDTFRRKLADFMTHFFKPKSPINFENLFILNGALVSVDILSFLLTDAKDVFLCPVPGYNGYFQAGTQRWETEVVSIPLTSNQDTNEPFVLKLESIENVALKQKRLGKNVRGIILNNPSNPLGTVWNKELVEGIMKFCQREKIHLIADEMYCMSVFDKSTQFHSTLEIHSDELMDAGLLHVIWGFSKDLCLTAFRTGVIHSKNRELQLKLMCGSQFQAVSLPIMDMLERIISDIGWFEQTFVPTNHERLQSSYDKARNFMSSLGIATTKTKAGFFFLANFSPFLKPPTKENCKAFIKKLYEHGVHITPGWEMRAEPGWFRLVYTPYLGKGLDEGLLRLKNALQNLQDKNIE